MIVTLNDGTTAETGCLVDGHWGQYALDRMILIAMDLGYEPPVEVDDVVATVRARLAGNGDDNEYEGIIWLADEAERWLSVNVAPDDYSYGWFDGEFFLESDEWWEETYG